MSTFLFTGCVKSIERKVTTENSISHKVIPANYRAGKEEFRKELSAMTGSDAHITTSVTTNSTNGIVQEETNFLKVELRNPENFPENGLAFNRLSNEIQKELEKEIENIEDYQKLEIQVVRASDEEGSERTQSYKKEIDL